MFRRRPRYLKSPSPPKIAIAHNQQMWVEAVESDGARNINGEEKRSTAVGAMRRRLVARWQGCCCFSTLYGMLVRSLFCKDGQIFQTTYGTASTQMKSCTSTSRVPGDGSKSAVGQSFHESSARHYRRVCFITERPR